jgi:hypothetical protein
MLKLHREGHIELPPPRTFFTGRGKSLPVSKAIDIEQTPITSTVKNLQPIKIRQVRRTNDEKLFNDLIERYHYLGYNTTGRRTP